LAAYLDLPAQPGFRFPGCPVPRSLFAEPASDSLRLPPRPRPFGCAGDVPFRFPRTSHTFGVAGFSKVLGCPSCSRFPPAAPAIQISGCPSFCTSGFTGDGSSSRLDSRIFGGAGCESSRLPLRFAPPVSPTIRRRVASVPHPPAPADHQSESPRTACHPVASLLPPDCSGCPRLASSSNRFPSRPGSFVVRRR